MPSIGERWLTGEVNLKVCDGAPPRVYEKFPNEIDSTVSRTRSPVSPYSTHHRHKEGLEPFKRAVVGSFLQATRRTKIWNSFGAELKSDATCSGMWSIVIESAMMRVRNFTESFPVDPAMPQQLPISIVSY